ncbi:MAG: alpha-L-glutamate ligase-like protein [Legionella sp.]|nr:alpha-L-glutamate ligase-like protein [Legionella sp.]
MWKIYRRLRAHGILSMNQRNRDYILRYNERWRYPLVDDKLKTKQLAIKAGIAVPPLYQTITSEHQIKQFPRLLADHEDFVVKPAHGTGGEGILVITDRVMNRYRQINGQLLTEEDLGYHLSCLLSGAYSLGGHSDYAIIEHRVIVDPVFEGIIYEGVPDIRIITLLGYPVMAMARLPTRLSKGKANLHMGGIGIGIDLATGKTLQGVFHHQIIDRHPDTLKPLEGITLPFWETILEIAARCYELTGLGYLGVDIVLDKDRGPLMLELNARPGLAIQVANQTGGLSRYKQVEEQASKFKEQEPALSRVAYSQSRFGV